MGSVYSTRQDRSLVDGVSFHATGYQFTLNLGLRVQMKLGAQNWLSTPPVIEVIPLSFGLKSLERSQAGEVLRLLACRRVSLLFQSDCDFVKIFSKL